MTDVVTSAQQQARLAWSENDPSTKCALVASLAKSVESHTGAAVSSRPPSASYSFDDAAATIEELEPGRPSQPKLVHASAVAKRQTGRAGGRGPMLHAIAHIEFNAINLALDAVWRYPGMPPSFTFDWISVAADEARHFQMLCDELVVEGHEYGDFDAHDGLWSMAQRTAEDLVARMALVPRVLEARGLDATPVIQRKFAAIGDTQGVELLQVLLDEEIRHVKIGDYWFRALCNSRALDAEATYRELVTLFKAPMPKPPINTSARIEAGFSADELQWLNRMNKPNQ